MIEHANAVFQISSNAHNHPAEVEAAAAASITAKVKARAVTMARVHARVANRQRQRLRPNDPTDLDFKLDEENIPDGFLRDRRHLLFVTDQQLEYLAEAKSWYIDRIF